MELENAVVPAANRFASLYIENIESVKDFFEYNIKEETVFQQRYEDLMEREFNREAIADCIESYMSKFPASAAAEHSLEKLRNDQSVVVIGGQQAGLLTGPLYTIHKIISIVKLAEQQERLLKKPVVPIFWVAGEDHDYLEINHVYVKKEEQFKKLQYHESFLGKKMASDTSFSKEEMQKWVHHVFFHLGEQTYTKEMLTIIDEAINNTNTFTEFFSYIVMHLFKDTGLLLIDSADTNLRQVEKPFFSYLINHQSEITDAVLSQQEKLKGRGFQQAIEIDAQAANLFLYQDGERVLLEFDPAENNFVNKTNDSRFTKEELHDLLELSPEQFSNNVVTRPLMQEWLFPTLAFIAGPGEVAYWGELLTAFQSAGNKMPPIVPRLNITLLDKTTERNVSELNLTVTNVLRKGTSEERSRFLKSIQDERLNQLLSEAKNCLVNQYEKVTARIEEIDRGHVKLANTNLDIHMKQLDFLEKKVEESVQKKHMATLDKYLRVEQHLCPGGQPQERMWNVFAFLIAHGKPFIDLLLALPYEFDGTHKIIKI